MTDPSLPPVWKHALEARIEVLEDTCARLATAVVALAEGKRPEARTALKEAQELLERVSKRPRRG